MLDNYDQRFGSDPLLRDKPTGLSKYQETSSIESLYSVEAAINMIKSPRQLKPVVDTVVKGKIPGGADAFHLLIELCKSFEDYDAAYDLCKYALTRYKNYQLLYSDIFEIGINHGKCDFYLKKLLLVDDEGKKTWSLRLFNSIFEYLDHQIKLNLGLGGGNQFELIVKYYEPAKQLAKDMQRFYREKEEGYYAEVKLLFRIGKRDDARRVLERWIFDPLNPEKDSKKLLRCPNCCRFWLKHFRDCTGDRRVIQYIIIRGLKDSDEKDDIDFFKEQKESFSKILLNQLDAEDCFRFEKNTAGFTIDTYNTSNTL